LTDQKVYVNYRPIEILPGMMVKLALIGAGLLKEIEESKKVYGEWGE
jgi:hypothetical protein